jgi:peptidoglycan/LPS O-acetylase OafA/YrhL
MMLLGIYLHAAVAFSRHGSWPWKDGSTTAVFDLSLGFIHAFRMPAFYVMAGFFAALLLEQRGPAGFLRNRAVRILLPFAAGWAVLFPLVAALVTVATNLEEPRTIPVKYLQFFSWFLGISWFLGLSMCLFVFGFTGLFLRYLERPVPWIRYLSDSSYWLYLMHMPVLLVFQITVAGTGWTPAVRALVVLAASVPTLLASYHVLVRSTWVGAILNGQRYSTLSPAERAGRREGVRSGRQR